MHGMQSMLYGGWNQGWDLGCLPDHPGSQMTPTPNRGVANMPGGSSGASRQDYVMIY